MKIEVLGPGCTNCKKLEQDVHNALAELKIEAEVIKVTDMKGVFQIRNPDDPRSGD
jgi:hypothetical protein